MTRFGYLVPEFPGQTHAFFWRELKALMDLGQHPEPVSTRRPRQTGITPPWAQDGLPETKFLMPPSPKSVSGSAKSALPGLHHLAPLAEASGLRRQSNPKAMARDVLRTAGLFWAGAELAHHAHTRGWSHIHVHSCADSAQVALFAHLLTGIPYSLTLHGPLSDYGPNQQQKWRNAKFSIVITEKLLNETRKQLDGFMPANVEVAPMGVELAAFTRAAPYIPWQGTGPARIFSCGRLNPSKGHIELLSALRSVVDTGVEAVLTIAGEDDHGGKGYRAAVERAVTERGLTPRVTLLGAVPESRIKAELENAHLFALASHEEPLGVAIMEAMAMQVPIVATSAGGVPDLVASGHTGTLVEPGNSNQLTAAILNTLHSPSQATAMGQRARLRLEESYDVRASARALAALI
ncbi:exopolysaccharide biosynthesis GT4 family glycosyltransferase EpsE [Paenarthrobacter sp. NCHU4564]|uniref:exopolysaccharide biosynthesis GT4 family glycosyltransferase EpsE n=1 Tax=Paenarthrobacter sp. NCHU4564 TaxID=3451353 RepID=UPI003F9D2C97